MNWQVVLAFFLFLVRSCICRHSRSRSVSNLLKKEFFFFLLTHVSAIVGRRALAKRQLL